MKKIYLLVLFFSCLGFSQTENFPYERDWATYTCMPLDTYSYEGDLIGYFIQATLTNYPVLQDYLNPQDTLGNMYLGKISPQGNIEFIRRFGGSGGTTLASPNEGGTTAIDLDKNIYVSGVTNHTSNIATIGSFQPNFSNNISLPAPFLLPDGNTVILPPQLCIDGYLVKMDSLGNKIWGTYLNGDQNVSILKVKTKNNFLYVHGKTSSNNNLTTPNSFYPNRTDTLFLNKERPFIARLNPENGNVLWCSYVPDWLYDNGFDLETLAINSIGDIYISSDGHNTIKKISNDGSQILGSYEIPEMHEIVDISIDNNNQLLISGRTSLSTGVATPGTFITTKTLPTENCLVKYNINMQKIWGTYLGTIYNNNSFYFDHRTNNMYFGISTEIENLSTINAYQEQIAGGIDDLIIKLTENGQLAWSTYYGGELNENGANLKIMLDTNENLYFNSTTSSLSYISTPEALFPIHPITTFPNSLVAVNYSVKFNNTTTANTNNNETIPYLIYPNPVQDVLNIQSPILFDTDSEFKIYDLNGKLVHSQKGEYANVNVLFLSHFAAVTYILEIDHQGKKQTQKFIKK